MPASFDIYLGSSAFKADMKWQSRDYSVIPEWHTAYLVARSLKSMQQSGSENPGS